MSYGKNATKLAKFVPLTGLAHAAVMDARVVEAGKSKIAPVLKQRTLKTLTRAVGVGLHSGQRVEITLRPAQPDTGIVFRRVDLPEPVDIPVSTLAVTDTRMASTISSGNAKVHTVEHLMSACAGLGVDNLYVDITAEEVPILDGSASSFVFLLQSAGIVFQEAPRRFIRLLKPV